MVRPVEAEGVAGRDVELLLWLESVVLLCVKRVVVGRKGRERVLLLMLLLLESGRRRVTRE